MRINSWYAVGIIFLALAAGACSPPKTDSNPSSAQIRITIVEDYDEQWKPAAVTIKPGGSVTWTNTGHVVHSIISDQDLWPDWKISPGESHSVIIKKSGNFTYHDETDTYKNSILVQ